MKNYDFTTRFHALYDKAVGLYTAGRRDTKAYFAGDDDAWLTANGLTAQHLYDYAEDQINHGEPGYDNALGIELVRRDYFLNVQGGKTSRTVLDEKKLPAKTDTILGMTWLARIIPKAKAKLRGELPASLMYCCGGDRNFLQVHDIQPAEFLGVIWRHEHDDAAIVNWVAHRSAVVIKMS